LILCDPPIESVDVWKNKVPERISVKGRAKPFQGGYADFIYQPENLTDAPPGPPRTSLAEDLCYYIEQRHSTFQKMNPSALARMLLKKIISLHYLQLINFGSMVLSDIEFSLVRKDNLGVFTTLYVEETWSSVQDICHRCTCYAQDICAILTALGIPLPDPGLSQQKERTCSETDFQLIYLHVQAMKKRAEQLNTSVTGLASIVGNRQALHEAKNVKTLTLIGMIFIPLAFISGLFSMNDTYIPGADRFWLYFAVSLPLVAIIFILAFIINLGYDQKEIWSWREIFRKFSRSCDAATLST